MSAVEFGLRVLLIQGYEQGTLRRLFPAHKAGAHMSNPNAGLSSGEVVYVKPYYLATRGKAFGCAGLIWGNG